MKAYKIVIVEQNLPYIEFYFTSFPSKEDVINKLFYNIHTPKAFSDYFYAISNCQWPKFENDKIIPEFIIVKYLNGWCADIKFEIIEVHENE